MSPQRRLDMGRQIRTQAVFATMWKKMNLTPFVILNSLYQFWRFENVLHPGNSHQGHD